MASNPPPKPKAGLSLYANLLDPSGASSSAATITAAPVTFKQPSSSDAAPDDATAAAAQKQQISTCRSRSALA